MRTKHALTSEDAHKMMAARKAKAQKNNWKVSIVIVDDAAIPLLLERLDGAGPTTAEVALGKARTVALTRQPTKLWEERVKERPAFLNFPAGLAIWGGVPILYQGECVGAIGVSGVQSQDDEKIASAGVAALTG
jgi:glc operon protein GlcG